MVEENKTRCPKCGAELSKDADECPECGTGLDDSKADIERVLDMVDEDTFEIKNGDSESVVSHIKRFADRDIEKKEIKEYPPEEDISDAVEEAEPAKEKKRSKKQKGKRKTKQKEIKEPAPPPPPGDEEGSKTMDKSKRSEGEPKRKKKKLQFMCPLCGTEVDEDDDKCPGCGAIFE